MAERGRPSASSGNAYHDTRVAHCLINLLEDASFTSVAVETFDATDDLVVRRSDGKNRYEQVKERAPRGKWTALRLTSEFILDQFIQQYRSDPSCELVFFTGSDASEFREVTERARNASTNHSYDVAGRATAVAEWRSRLNKDLRRFVDKILFQITKDNDGELLSLQDLHAVLACVTVLDTSGTTEQLRNRGVQRLRNLVGNPTRAFQTLERLACDAAIRRGVLTRRDVETALGQDGSGLRHAALSLAIDAEAYAEKIQLEANSINVAKLPSLEPRFRSSSDTPILLDNVTGKALLVGGHGAGKSRIAAELAVRSIQSGRQCLHVRLARWATTLCNLLVTELSRATTRHATLDDFGKLFGKEGVLVLDGLDEIPLEQRLKAEREIIEFTDTYPHLDILVTCRPGSGSKLLQYWKMIHILPLGRDQIDETLGRGVYTPYLAEPIVTLASNPLMLGLLVQHLASGTGPSSEADLLDRYIREIVERDASRNAAIDKVTGLRLAEDLAFKWLSSGRIALEEDQIRNVAAAVALGLRSSAQVQLDAREVERWLEETGFGIRLEGVVVPVHRALLDHLAGRSMSRRDVVQCTGRAELREAVARYLGAQTEVSDTMLSLLNAVGTDLELLARGRRLTPKDITWPFGPTKFAMEYLADLRRLGTGPLVDVGVVDQPVEIDIDTEISWITERDHLGIGDVTNIVATPDRPYMIDSDGSNRTQVQAFSLSGHHGAEIDIKVPHYCAADRVKYELESLLRRRALPNEGPDIVYERLCVFAKQFRETVTAVGPEEYGEFSDVEFCDLTATTLWAHFVGTVAKAVGAESVPTELSNIFIMFVPGKQKIAILERPYTSERDFGFRLGVHGGELTRLLTKATEFKIAEFPLHPLMLLPSSAADPVLALPGDRSQLHGKSLSLYVERHELGGMRAFRHLVENNFIGLAPFLRQYSTMPWSLNVAIEERVGSGAIDARIESVRNFRAEFDEVVLVSEVSTEDALWSSSCNMRTYRGVLDAAYERVEDDLSDLMNGSNPLGSNIL